MDRIRQLDSRHIELTAFTLLILLVNLPLFLGHVPARMILDLNGLMQGQWWRLVTHPFCHVSPYHLLLDGSAFLMLYESLSLEHTRDRLKVVLFTGIGSLLGAVMFSDLIAEHGLCGLSGIAHGLMAVVSLEWISDHRKRRQGWVLFLIIIGKTVMECVTGDVMFASMHLGRCGLPIVSCHAGGVTAGLLYGLISKWRRS